MLGASLHPARLAVFDKAARFVDVSESEFDQFKENAVLKKQKNGMLQNFESSYSKVFKGRLIKFLFCK